MCDECPSIKDYNIMKELLPELNIPEYDPLFDNINICSIKNCNSKLCDKHTETALIFGKYYLNKNNFKLCHKCCCKIINNS